MIKLTAALSEKCNLNCSYCNINKHSIKVMNADLFIVEFFKMRQSSPQEHIQVDFYGGEPLMQLKTIKQIVETVEVDDNISFFMPTNGLLLTEDIAQYLIDHKIEVSISFDGLWHEKNRLLHNGRGTSHLYLKKKDLFHTLPNVTFHTMITKGCYNILENYLYIKEVFGINTELTFVRDVGVWDTHSVEKLKIGINELFNWYIDNHEIEEIPYIIKFYMNHYTNYIFGKHTHHSCGAGTTIYMFNENNNLLPCVRFENNPNMVEQIPRFLDMKKCRTCEVKNYCTKGCLHEQMINGEPIDELCEIYKHMYTKISQMINILKDSSIFKRTFLEEMHNDRKRNQ